MRDWLDKQRDYITCFDLYTWFQDQFWPEALKELICDDLEDLGVTIIRE